MARPKKEETKEENTITPQERAKAFFNQKDRKKQHFNFDPTHSYKTPSSSLLLTSSMDGGLGCGAHRFMGVTESGKTSCALDFLYNFLLVDTGNKRRGIYIKAEGRLSDNIIERSGIKFVFNPDDWVDGTTFVVESNIYEFVFDFLKDQIMNNETETEFFIIIDSMDMLIKADDAEKSSDKSSQVAGGALMTATFLKKTSLALSKKGHTCIFISQYRETIREQNSGPAAPRQGTASGGHAVEHAGDWAFEFQKPRNWKQNGDIIRENDSDNGESIGHWCRMKVHKSPNESTTKEFSYPVRYKRTGAKSVWLERELGDLILGWGWAEAKGAWITFDPNRLVEIKKETGVDFPEKIQGMANLYKTLEDNEVVCKYLFNVFVKLIVGK